MGILRSIKPTSPTNESSRLGVKDVVTSALVLDRRARIHDSGLTLVDHVHQVGIRHQCPFCGDRLADLEVLLAVQEHHGVEVGDDGGDVERWGCAEGGDDAEGWEDLEVFVAFVHEGEVGAFAA